MAFPSRKRVIVNLAPAAVRKEGPAYDLPIALGVLITNAQLPQENLENTLVIGELSLDGSVRHVRGVLPMAALARQQGIQRLFVPHVDAAEAALIPELEVIPVASLAELFAHLEGVAPIAPERPARLEDLPVLVQTDFSEIKGQEHVKRALEVAAAGGAQRPDDRPARRGQDAAGALAARHPAAHDHRRSAGRDAHLFRGRPAARRTCP